MRELFSHPESIDLARAVLAEHFGTFTLEPTTRDGEPVYLAHGKVDFFGDKRWRERMVPGARIELATPAFSGRRSTTELPRLINNLQDTNSDWCQYWCQFAFHLNRKRTMNLENYIG
jgi:hypothetical protein